MFVNKDSIVINGISMGQYLTQVDYEYNKLWASDSGRNLAGVQTGTLIGIFPKLVLQFRSLNKEEIQTLAPIFDSEQQTVRYWDDNKGEMTTMKTYSGDWKDSNKRMNKCEPFSISFIAKKRRA